MIFRIGDRDPVTGLYDVIHPDGSFTRNGIKIFNSAHEFGDVVMATERSDGMLILDGVKATLTEVVNTSFGLGGFGEKPVGYLAGQVFNNEEEVILPTVSIKFAPGSSTELEPGDEYFVVRVEIDRPQRKDLRVKLELSGTAVSEDYIVNGLDNAFAIIPAGALYLDVGIIPIQNSLGANETVVIDIVHDVGYRVGQENSITATILGSTVVLPFIFLDFAPGSPLTATEGLSGVVLRVSINIPQNINIQILLSANLATLNSTDFDQLGLDTFSNNSATLTIPANAAFADFTLSTKISDTLVVDRSIEISLVGCSIPADFFGDKSFDAVFNRRVFLLRFQANPNHDTFVQGSPVFQRQVYASSISRSNMPFVIDSDFSINLNWLPSELQQVDPNLQPSPVTPVSTNPLNAGISYFYKYDSEQLFPPSQPYPYGRNVDYANIDVDVAAAYLSSINKRYLLIISGYIAVKTIRQANGTVTGYPSADSIIGVVSAAREKKFLDGFIGSNSIDQPLHPTNPEPQAFEVFSDPYYRLDTQRKGAKTWEKCFSSETTFTAPARTTTKYLFANCFQIDTQNPNLANWIPITLTANANFPNPISYSQGTY